MGKNYIDVDMLVEQGFVLAKVKTNKDGEVVEFMTVNLQDAPYIDLEKTKVELAKEIFERVERCVLGTIEPSFIQLRDEYINPNEKEN
jgi:hypothetical protein